MRLQKVPVGVGGPLTFVCCRCGNVVKQQPDPPAPQTGMTVYADLDGEAYRTYYCSPCAAPIITFGGLGL